MRILCVGGVADGEPREFFHMPHHGFVFEVRESVSLGRPGDKVPAAATIRSEAYRLHGFAIDGQEKWIAAPADWTTAQLFARLTDRYLP